MKIKTEVLAGITTFLATLYIVVVNPAILSNTGMPFAALVTATVMVVAISSILMGLYAKTPIVLAPGMGLNAFFAFSVVLGMQIPWQTALGAVFWSGIIFVLLSIFNVRTMIVAAIPQSLRYAISLGIGFFIALIGLVQASVIVANPATLISLGKINSITITFFVGLIVTSILVIKKIQGALLWGIIFSTLISIPIGRWWGDASVLNHGVATLVTWKGFFAWPDFGLLLQLDLWGSLKFAMWPVIFAFLFTDMFDSLSTFIGVSEAADLLDEQGNPRNIKKCLIVDGVSTTISGLLGSSPGTSYIESAAGVQVGGRSGLTAVVAGCLFLPFLFLSPMVSIVPTLATAPILVLVGVYMMGPIKKIDWGNFEEAIPCFLAMLLIPLTYSITQGIVWGFLSYSIIKLIVGKAKEIHWMLWVIDCFAVAALVF